MAGGLIASSIWGVCVYGPLPGFVVPLVAIGMLTIALLIVWIAAELAL
jgi:hypothetical protein